MCMVFSGVDSWKKHVWLIKCVNATQIILYTLVGYMLSYNFMTPDNQDINSNSFNVSYVNYLNFIVALVKSLCGYSCVASKQELNMKCQHVVALILTAITFSIYPATSWLSARYGYHDAPTSFCYVMPIVVHNFCLTIHNMGKYILGLKMEW